MIDMAVYAFAKNAVKLDYHLEAWITQNCEMFKEVKLFVIGTGDGTLELTVKMANEHDNFGYGFIKESQEKDDNTPKWYRTYKKKAFDLCNNDVRCLLDVDEMFHENQEDVLNHVAKRLRGIDKNKCYPLEYVKFAGNYLTQYIAGFEMQWRIINALSFLGFSRDGGNVVVLNMDDRFEWYKTYKRVPKVYHYNVVRDPKALAYKWHVQGQRGRKGAPPEKDLNTISPHKFSKIKNRDNRKVIKRTLDFHPKYVREHPKEFFRVEIDAGDKERHETEGLKRNER